MFVWSFAAGVVGPGALIVEGHLRPPPPKLLARSGRRGPPQILLKFEEPYSSPCARGDPT